MNGGTSVIGIQAESTPAAEEAVALVDESPAFVPSEGVEPPSSGPGAFALVAILVSVLWVAGMAWWARGAIGTLDPVGMAQFVAALLAVPVLIGIGWLVVSRADNALAEGLLASSRAMRRETEDLARTAAGLSEIIAANREALAGQVRALSAIGDSATARLAAIGRGLSEEIDQADIHARALTEATAAAESRLAVLLATMPRAQSEAESLGQMIERIGLGAGAQVAGLDAQLVALADRGHEAEVIASGSAQKLAAHIARMDATSQTAGERLDAVTGAMATQIDALLDRTAGAVDESRKGIAAQGEAMLAMIQTSQVALDTAARGSAEALAERIEIVELVIDRVTRRLEAQRQAGDSMVRELEGWIDQAEGRFDVLHGEGTRRAESLAASITALSGSADTMTEALRVGDAVATRAVGTAETLLIALDSATREMDETLAGALARLDARLDLTRQRIATTQPDLLALVTAAGSTQDAIDAVATAIADQRRDADQVATILNEGLAAGRDAAASMEGSVDTAITRADRFVEDAAPRLLEALLRVRDTAASAADSARETLETVIPQATVAFEAASAAALRRAAGDAVEAQIASVAEVAEAAVAAATRAADRLEQQVDRLSAATIAVDTRIEDARLDREKHDRDNFARSASLLIESMNSASIDLSRSLAPEINDAAWAAYLKGDRGVFTRRAVRLLDATEQRDVARLYDDNPGFRDQVNRYIHDFESMLRTILAQRDGSPLGITLLSSDMGKLYVAMAQAIERLR